jgi:tetratricopeptide (TPR) repeat protein
MEEAISDCNLSLDLQSNDADTRDSRAFVYLKISMLEEAIGDYAIALGLNPNLPLWPRCWFRTYSTLIGNVLQAIMLFLASRTRPSVASTLATIPFASRPAPA